MKKTIITLGLCLVFSGLIYAQATETGMGPRLEVNQYGQLVETSPIEVTLRNGVTWFENRERGYRFWFDGRVQVDFANFHNQRNGTIALPDGQVINGVGQFTHPDATPHMPGGLSLRRVRFAVKAQVTDQWYGEVDFNMANGTFGLQDAYIQFNPRIAPAWQFRLGNFKEDFSMEYTTSSRFVTFMERPMPITAFNFTRRLGFQTKWHDMNMSPWLRVSGGVTLQEIDDLELRESVVVNQNRGVRGPGPNFTGKVVLMPWATNPDQGLHFGYNIQHRSGRWIDAEGPVWADNQRSWYAMRVNSRNSTHINRTSYLDTRWIEGVRGNLFQGVELAGFWNSWRFSSEFIWHNMIMDRNLWNFPTFTAAHAAESGLSVQELTDLYAQNKRFWGFYVQAGKLLFGGRQRYDIRQSEFTQPIRGRSWGDVEILFRYDFLDLNNNHNDRPIHMLAANGSGRDTRWGQAGGAAHNFTFGISYWINDNMRFTLNYQITQTDVWANGGSHVNSWTNRHVAVGRDMNGHFTANPLEVVSEPGVRFNALQMRFEMWF